MKVVIDNAIPYIQGVLEPYAEVLYRPGASFSAEDVRDADALIIRTRTRCSHELLEGSSVKLIATATIGFDHIDLDYCRNHNITVATSAGCNARGVLQWVSASLAQLAKREGFTPHERTIGIVGVGNVGRLVKEYAERWGFRTICCDPPREEREKLGFKTLEEVLQQADIVTLHTPLNQTTRHLIGKHNISLLKSGATVINASRGEVVDTEATTRNDLTYIVDVWEGEPDLDTRLLAKATIATPHIAGYSLQGKANASAMVVEAVAHRFGLPLKGWYPEGVTPTCPQAISWAELLNTIEERYDIMAESEVLKGNKERFEQLRNNYLYRNEYF